MSFTLAVSYGPVSLVAGLVGVQPLFVFVFATVISLFYPKFIKEKISKTIMLQKTIAIVMIIIGGLLII